LVTSSQFAKISEGVMDPERLGPGQAGRRLVRETAGSLLEPLPAQPEMAKVSEPGPIAGEALMALVTITSRVVARLPEARQRPVALA
jgi:hypothetical protein